MDVLNNYDLSRSEDDEFLVPKMDVEMPLYRYRGNFEYIVDEIANDHIYLSPLDKLNDPLDSSCSMSFEEACQEKNPIKLYYLGSYFFSRDEWYDELGAHIDAITENRAKGHFVTLAEFSEIVSNFIKTKGIDIDPIIICKMYYNNSFNRPTQRKTLGKVASFSETWESIPMWAYYADSHKGVCMKYEFNMLDNSNIAYHGVKNALHKVWYSDCRFRDPQGQFTPFVKSSQWAHEQEWRLFRETCENYLYLPYITEIYLGLNFGLDNVYRIVNELKKKDREIKLYKIYTRPDTYGLKRVRLNY
jgi:hypothetical protein